MPRQARIDFPGALHHIMVRGIEKREIFRDKKDKNGFLDRLEHVIISSETICYAFALLDNHFHLLFQTGKVPLSKVMQSLLTGHAVYFNRRHGRTGKLYQNRFKSILCEKDEYFLQLIRYIHLNPLRSDLVSNLAALDDYPWSSHPALIGKGQMNWYCADSVLEHFGHSRKLARQSYREFLEAGLSDQEAKILEGGGLVRSLGGDWQKVASIRSEDRQMGDERILGSGDFVEAVLDHAEERAKRSDKLQNLGWDFNRVLAKAGKTVGLKNEDLLQRGRGDSRAAGRALLCKWLADDLGRTYSSIAKSLGISAVAVSKQVKKGRLAEMSRGISLEP